WRKLWMMTGLKTFNSKLPCEPAKAIAALLPWTCTAIMVIASHWVGFTLPGMIDEPGSFSGMRNSPRPQRGPDASQRMSLAIFINDPAKVAMAPCANTRSSCAERAAKLVGCARTGRQVNAAILAAARTADGCGA